MVTMANSMEFEWSIEIFIIYFLIDYCTVSYKRHKLKKQKHNNYTGFVGSLFRCPSFLSLLSGIFNIFQNLLNMENQIFF